MIPIETTSLAFPVFVQGLALGFGLLGFALKGIIKYFMRGLE